MSNKDQTVTRHSDTAVEFTNVTKIYQQWQRENVGKGLLKRLLKPEKRIITALSDATFAIEKGEFVAYAGPNGAGKSTTMKLMCGMLAPARGEIRVMGGSPGKDRIALMRRMGVLFGNRTELWWDHPVSQSFEWKKTVWEIPDADFERRKGQIVELLELEPLLKTFARELSLGQRMRCDLALMLLHGPEMILLDEPTLGLDVVAKRQMIDFLKRLNREENTTVVITSHDMDDLEEMARRVLMIASGSIVYDGSFDGLRALTGQMSTVRIESDAVAEFQLEGGTLVERDHEVSLWQVDLGHTPVQELLAQVARVPGVRDVEIKKAPIEQVIASLYRQWGTPETHSGSA